MKKAAFIITVYQNDKLEYFTQAVESIVRQDYGFENINIYLCIDGIIPADIRNYIDENKNLFYKLVQNDENRGLAYSLNKLIDVLENEEYIFRMDSDDICKPDRVSKQMKMMLSNIHIDIVGGAIQEIDEEGCTKMVRTYPKNTEDAKKFIAKASIFAHPTVCFRRSFFEKGFRYQTKFFPEDLYLWFDALAKGIDVSNIDDIVLNFRTSNNFYNRRSYSWSIKEFKVYWHGIKKLYGYNWRLIYPIARIFIRLLPSNGVKIIYNSSMRRKLNIN